FFQAEDGIRDRTVTGVQTCALPIYSRRDRRGDHRFTSDVWFATSRRGRWQQRHLAGPFDGRSAPSTISTEVAGHFIGEYQGLVGDRKSVVEGKRVDLGGGRETRRTR